MNATQVVLLLWGFFIHGVSIHVNEVDLLLFFVGTVTREMTYFSTVEAGIIGGMRLVGIRGSSLEVLVSSSAPFLVSLPTPVRIGLAEIYDHWLVVHARWGVGCVILRVLFGIIWIVSSIEERVPLLVVL